LRAARTRTGSSESDGSSTRWLCRSCLRRRRQGMNCLLCTAYPRGLITLFFSQKTGRCVSAFRSTHSFRMHIMPKGVPFFERLGLNESSVCGLLCFAVASQRRWCAECLHFLLFAGVCDGGKRGRAAWARRLEGQMLAFTGRVVQSGTEEAQATSRDGR